LQPHFHASYGESDVVVEISSGKLLHVHLPQRSLRLLEEWRRLHKAELMAAWKMAQNHQTPERIKPLE